MLVPGVISETSDSVVYESNSESVRGGRKVRFDWFDMGVCNGGG